MFCGIAHNDDAGIARIKLHRAADTVCLLTCHKRRAAAAEQIHHHTVGCGTVLDGISQKRDRLHGRVFLGMLRLIEVPYCGLLAVGEPAVLAVGHPSEQYRLVLPLIGASAQDKRVLDPDAYAADVEAGFLESSAEVEPFRIGMEDISRAAFRHMSSHIAKCGQQKFIKLFVCHAVVLDGFAVSRFIRHVVGRIGYDQICLKTIHQKIHMLRIGAVAADHPVSAQRPNIA